MSVREILRMGDARLLRTAQSVTDFDSDRLHLLVSDLWDTMRAANGAGRWNRRMSSSQARVRGASA